MIPAPIKPDVFTDRGPVVSRTHRVIRERARSMQARRSRNRALFAPIAIASSLFIVLITTFWIMFDEYELSPSEVRFHLPLVLIWFLPLTGALLIVALVRRVRSRSARGEDMR